MYVVQLTVKKGMSDEYPENIVLVIPHASDKKYWNHRNVTEFPIKFELIIWISIYKESTLNLLGYLAECAS